MNDKIQKAPMVPPFVRFVCSAVPMVFDDSLSYYEALCALWKWLQDDVVNVINNNATVTEEYIELTKELKTFVEDYFDNLDVQEEINNKLDQMAEDGTLEEIMAHYLEAKVAWTFDTVAEMKASTNLVNGSYAQTLGYHSVNDGGAGIYKITNTGIANEMDVVAVGSLYAHLVTSTTLHPEMLGAYGDDTHDDSAALQRAFNLNNCNVELLNGKTYSFATTLVIDKRYFNFDGKGATLHYTGSGVGISVDLSALTSHQRDLTSIENFVLSAPASTDALKVNYANKCKFENIKVYDFPANGINIVAGCYECNFNNIWLACRKASSTVGITGNFGDVEFGNLYGCNVETFIYGKPWGSNNINKIHAWCFNGSMFSDEPAMSEGDFNTWLAGTKLIKVDNTTDGNAWATVINYVNSDTYGTCIDWNSYWYNFHINNLYMHNTTNLETHTSTYQSYVHRILIDHLGCPDSLETTIQNTQAAQIPHIRFVNDNEYEYVQTQTYTDVDNNSVTLYIKPNELKWIELPKPSANLTLNYINVYAFIPFKKEAESTDINLRRPYVGSNNNSFIYPTAYVDDATTAFALVRSFGTITSANSRLVPKATFTA